MNTGTWQFTAMPAPRIQAGYRYYTSLLPGYDVWIYSPQTHAQTPAIAIWHRSVTSTDPMQHAAAVNLQPYLGARTPL